MGTQYFTASLSVGTVVRFVGVVFSGSVYHLCVEYVVWKGLQGPRFQSDRHMSCRLATPHGCSVAASHSSLLHRWSRMVSNCCRFLATVGVCFSSIGARWVCSGLQEFPCTAVCALYVCSVCAWFSLMPQHLLSQRTQIARCLLRPSQPVPVLCPEFDLLH